MIWPLNSGASFDRFGIITGSKASARLNGRLLVFHEDGLFPVAVPAVPARHVYGELSPALEFFGRGILPSLFSEGTQFGIAAAFFPRMVSRMVCGIY
jgi:hypothetical protein